MNQMRNRVGLGTFPLVGVFNSITPDTATKLVRQFISSGGYYIDTAPLYGNGSIEILLGRALKDTPRDNFYLITKTVKHIDTNGKLFISGKYADVVEQMDNSLLRLGLDYVDLLMIHSPDPDVPIAETLSAMETLQKAGKVKDLAVSNVYLSELKEYNQTGKIKYVENRFSLINRSLSSEFEDYLLQNNIKLLPYHLLEIGMLTDIALGTVHLREGDIREQKLYWNSENQTLVFTWVKEILAPIAARLGITVSQLNIAWALAQSYIDFVIVGTTKPEYLETNLKAGQIRLLNEDLSEVENAYLQLVERINIASGQSIKDFRGLNDKYY